VSALLSPLPPLFSFLVGALCSLVTMSHQPSTFPLSVLFCLPSWSSFLTYVPNLPVEFRLLSLCYSSIFVLVAPSLFLPLSSRFLSLHPLFLFSRLEHSPLKLFASSSLSYLSTNMQLTHLTPSTGPKSLSTFLLSSGAAGQELVGILTRNQSGWEWEYGLVKWGRLARRDETDNGN
jgi:hypothetical protein